MNTLRNYIALQLVLHLPFIPRMNNSIVTSQYVFVTILFKLMKYFELAYLSLCKFGAWLLTAASSLICAGLYILVSHIV